MLDFIFEKDNINARRWPMQTALVNGIILFLSRLACKLGKLNAEGIQELTNLGITFALESKGGVKIICLTFPDRKKLKKIIEDRECAKISTP
jgi:hypothetical protein